MKPTALTGKARDVVMQELEAHHKAGFGRGVSYYRKFYDRGRDALNVKNGILALNRNGGYITLRGLYKYRKLLSDEVIELALDQLSHAKCSDVEISDWRDNWLGLADKPLVEKVRRQYSREYYLLRAMQLDEEKRKEIENEI